MGGNLQEGEGVERTACIGGLFCYLRTDFRRGLFGFVGGFQQFGRGGVPDLAELAVGQFEQCRQHIDTALELAWNRFFVLDLVVQHAPRILDDGAHLQLKRMACTCSMLGQRPLGRIEPQVQVQALVAKRSLGALNGGHLVGDFHHIKMRAHQVGHLFELVFIQADHAHPDQVGDVGGNFIGQVGLFQRRPVLAGEFLDALGLVLDPALHLGYIHLPGRGQQCRDQRGKRRAGLLQALQVLLVEGMETGFLPFKIKRWHRGCLENAPVGWIVRPAMPRTACVGLRIRTNTGAGSGNLPIMATDCVCAHALHVVADTTSPTTTIQPT